MEFGKKYNTFYKALFNSFCSFQQQVKAHTAWQAILTYEIMTRHVNYQRCL